MSTLPSKPGFYWAKWRIATDGTQDADELTPSDEWEVVEVWENQNGEPGVDDFMVSVTGVARSQALDGFVWGAGPLAREVEQ